jgi:endonuclease/exonuclease/phosphatase (EEP) superfamily protein YafD
LARGKKPARDTGTIGALRGGVLWLAVLPLLAWAVMRGFGLEGHSGLAPLVSFTPYATIGAFFLLGLCVAARNWPAAALSACAFAVLAVAVLPRTIGSGETAPPGSTEVTVLSSNVYHGRAQPAALMALVDRVQPDLLSVQELNHSLAAQLRRRGLERELPYKLIDTREGVTGAGLYSRYPLRPLPGPEPSNSRMQAGELALPDGRHLKVINVHPFTPTSNHAADWAAELGELPHTGTGVPWLLAGDFNATLDHTVLREVLERGYRDAAAVTGAGLKPTWPDNRRLPPLIVIDHVLADNRIGITDFGVESLPGTDHRAVFATVFLRPG